MLGLRSLGILEWKVSGFGGGGGWGSRFGFRAFRYLCDTTEIPKSRQDEFGA